MIPRDAMHHEYNRYTYAVWYDEQHDAWSWRLVGQSWEWKQEAGMIQVISGEGLGSWHDACCEAKRVLDHELE